MVSININVTTIYSAFGLAFSGKLYLLDSNTIVLLRNSTIFNIPNKAFGGKPVLVVGDLYKLSLVNARQICTASLNFEHPISHVMKDL